MVVLLVADPDPDIASKVAVELEDHAVRVISCADGADALLLAGAEHPDAVLAAAALPTISGATFVRTLAARTGIPVVLGVSEGDGQAAVEGLAAGAAACVVRPYRLSELLPLLLALRPLEADGPALQAGTLRLDPASLSVQLRGEPVRLPMRELKLLQLLMSNADKVVTREQIHDAVWGGVQNSNTVTVHVQRLRQRLGDDQHDPKLILTIRGVGYRLVPPA